ncbi:hypothetical protein CPAV1605_556 [seawater metagenome]|uniref:Uncharacterized protein n=1 Tax=seawater metagenome TaxID=1561972 RepID=A0A5E8CHW6_9ZZZZ
MDVFDYRLYVLGGLNPKKYNTVLAKDIHKYSNYTTFIQTSDNYNRPELYMIGYNIETIDGLKWYPVFCHELGDIKINVNKELIEKYNEINKKKIIKTLMNCNLPFEICCHIIYFI